VNEILRDIRFKEKHYPKKVSPKAIGLNKFEKVCIIECNLNYCFISLGANEEDF
jgi:hypothetical protein